MPLRLVQIVLPFRIQQKQVNTRLTKSSIAFPACINVPLHRRQFYSLKAQLTAPLPNSAGYHLPAPTFPPISREYFTCWRNVELTKCVGSNIFDALMRPLQSPLTLTPPSYQARDLGASTLKLFMVIINFVAQ